jgi:hypothetical protein
MCGQVHAGLVQGRAINRYRPRPEVSGEAPQQRLVELVISWWDEYILAKGSLVVSFFLSDGGTFRWAKTQRRGLGSARTRPATTEPMDMICILMLKWITLVVF